MNREAARTTSFEITQEDAVEQFLSDAYGTAVRIRTDESRPWLRLRRTEADGLAVESVDHGSDLDLHVGPLESIIVMRTTTALVERSCGADDRRYGIGEVFLISHPGRPYTARWLPGEVRNCVIDREQVGREVAPRPGRAELPVRFTGLDPRTPQVAAHWRATQTYVSGIVEDPLLSTSPLVVSSAVRMLTLATLATFPNTWVTEPTAVDRHDATVVAVRRAVAFIDENAGDDISSADIAGAAHVTIRSIRLAFRRHLNMSPVAYLRRVRLDHAHRDLVDGDPGVDTVSAVALRWGFASHSRFAAHYRHEYGVTPSSTLHDRR